MNKYYFEWNEKTQDWDINLGKFRKQYKNFFKCPHCSSDKLYYDLVYKKDIKKFETVNWSCEKCAKSFDFKNLSKTTQNFIENLALKELNLIYNKPVKIVAKNKKGVDVSFKALGQKIGVKFDNEFVDYKCGSCGTKNQFNVIEDNLYQCKYCGFYNLE